MASLVSVSVTLLLGLFPIRLSDIVYRCKWITSYLYLRIYKRVKQNRLDIYDLTVDKQPEKVGFVSHPIEIQLESPCPESHLAKADDKIICYGVNSKEECLFVSVSRLYNGKAEASVYMRLADGKSYQLENVSGFQQTVGEKNVFSCGDLQMYYLCPMRRWRIFFSGFLKETSAETPDNQRMAYVKFSLLWKASSDVYDNLSDMKDSNIVDSVARVEWKSIVPPINKLNNALDFYAQSGVIMGTVSVDDTLEDYEMYLFGGRMRYLGDMSFMPEAEFSLMLGYVHRNGIYVYLGDFSAPDIAKNIKYGFVVKPNAEIRNIETMDVSKEAIDSGGAEEMKGTIVAGRSYAFCGSVAKSLLQMNTTERHMTMSEVQFYLNGKKGKGIYIKGKFFGTRQRKVSDVLPPTTIPERLFPFVVPFTEEFCQLSEITGGKGSSLGKLTHLSAELQTFIVPSGMVVTTSSYKEFISRDVLEEIKNLEDVLYGNKEGDVKVACKRVHNKIVSSTFPSCIRDNIAKNLKKIFGENHPQKKFAVRSSATGEDTEQMSAAGQMDTFLGISGLNNIIIAVIKCWASQFGFTAVQYKRRYGQILNTPMAVVIQEMVQCDVAGVLFTCDPVSGNPTKMSIAANYGLGESVVSGSEEPDTIELDRNYMDELKIHQVTVGSKSHKIIVTDDGTALDDIPESERQECCLSAENSLRLGKLAIAIEKQYRSRRDIEWGIQNNILYIFQSRPVTSGTQETDYEIEHELDGPLRVENDHFSVSNTGEVLPGAMATFSLDMFFRMFNILSLRETENMFVIPVKAKYFQIGWLAMRNHAMFNISDTFRKGDRQTKDHGDKAMMVAFFGRVLEEEEPFQIAADRYGDDPPQMSWKRIYFLAKIMFFGYRRLKRVQKLYANYRIPIEKYETSKDLFNAMISHCCDLGQVMNCHMLCSQSSTMWNMQVLTTLSQAKDDIDNDVYSDFATLITNKGDVESADVPSAIQSLAFHIKKSIDPKKFGEMKTEDALHWLKTTTSSAGKKFNEFIDKHGHRCLKEFDIYSIPWGSDPKPLVRLLQSLSSRVTEDTADIRNTSITKLIKQLKVPIGLLSKLKLMLLVPLSRKGVRERETSTSLFVKGMDAWRKGYRALAKLMVSEGRIPNEDIMFFMTVEDVKELLETRSPSILAKAYHRQRQYPKMDGYIYPEIMRGMPRPINETADDVKPEEGLFSMKGIPVSQGVAKGYIRVAITIDDAAELKPGEIMLAYSTDIGWTPYFPTLAGVATELGGLISHGAVVSREYGLPCIAGLHGATRRFQTGDYVLLDGNKGILQKLQPPS